MSIFTSIKESVALPDAARYYGIDVPHNHMICCPFHGDRHPSMKLNEDYFYCFGCQQSGDVITFTAKLFDLTNYQAARKLAEDFGVSYDDNAPPAPKKPRQPTQREQEENAFYVLIDYLRLLEFWKEAYQPTDPDAPFDDRYVEACQMENRIRYMTEILVEGEPEEKKEFLDRLIAEDKVRKLENYIMRMRGKEWRSER